MATKKISIYSIEIILFLLFSTISYTQSTITISGIIVEQSGIPINYCNIALKGKMQGTLSDSTGYFQIQVQHQDTVILSALGYQDYKSLAQLINKDTFVLQRKTYDIKTIIITSKKLIPIKLGFQEKEIKKKNISGYYHQLIRSFDGQVLNTGAQIARFIDNPSENSGILQSVSFFIHKRGKGKTPFRIRIYSKGKNEMPKDDLSIESIVVTPDKVNDWFTINLRPYDIIIPKDGLFVAMEWLPTSEKTYWYKEKYKRFIKRKELKRKYRNKKLTGYGQLMGIFETKQKSKVYLCNNKAGWKTIDAPYEIMIKIHAKI